MTAEPIPLTPEQIDNWRSVMAGVIGSYALIMSEEQIQAMAGMMQEDINRYSEEMERKAEDDKHDRWLNMVED